MMKAKRGSALLIVIGMLAFMVISAVAFSAYMRYSRLPSSYLRRSSASRLLAKAALAEAIDEIDSAIGNNPHPGIGQNAYSYDMDSNSRATGQAFNRNAWKGRVYLGTNYVNNLVSPDRTVSTLTLEGLAYIPAPLVNEVRYYSRRTRSAQWKNLAFDSGRYAFCAVDVSDYLDVNSLAADLGRGTTADNRITLSYLFESDDHASASGAGGNPSSWDTFMANFSGSGKVPLISLADFNLALYDKQPSGWRSYFCDYVKNGNSSFYGGVGPEGAAADLVRRQCFVTDSYFPESGEDPDHLDLCEEENQPFTQSELRANKSLYAIAMQTLANNKPFKRLEKCIDALGFCQLYDYLDANDEPLSLAIPTTERVPMICGISPGMQNSQLQVTPSVDPAQNGSPVPVGTPAVGSRYDMNLHVTYNISGLPSAPLEVIVAYPFRHETAQNDSYEVGGRMAYFLTVDGKPVGLRTYNQNDVLHLGMTPPGTANANQPIADAVYAVDLTPQTVSSSDFTGGQSGPKGALKRVSLRPKTPIPSTIQFLDAYYNDWDTYQPAPQGSSQPYVLNPTHSIIDATHPNFAVGPNSACKMKPLEANGTVAADFDSALPTTLGNAAFTAKLKVNLVVWAWVKNRSTGKYVDLVPACVHDDGDLNSRNTDNQSKMWGQQRLGAAYPLMRFDMSANAADLEFNSVNLQSALTVSGGGQLVVTPASAMVCDPRFNHAPESWFAFSGNISEQTWLDNCGCGLTGTSALGGNRDGDIFMCVSDNEELQSVYELGNLLRFTDFYEPGAQYGARNLNYAAPDSGSGANRITFASSVSDTMNNAYMWRTYDPFGRYRDGGDDFEGIGFHASCEGFKVTPFSTQTNVMMAAFANAPHDWRLSSGNEQTMSGIPEKASSFNAKYAWNAYSSGAKIDWYDLEYLCGAFMEAMRRDDNQADIASEKITWDDVWADLGWIHDYNNGEENAKYLLNGLQLAETSNQGRIWNSDREFLYGYWHDSFALKQQLFLVFVRAEPTMMGGGAVGQTPPQLGARAVALVWRDPTKSQDARHPHQTRVLFYRQFD